MNTQVIAFANHKGGVGKTASVANVSAILASRGKKVLMIDLDAQANLTLSFLSEIPGRTIYNAMIDRKDMPVYSIKENLDITPSSLEMIDIDHKISPRRIEYILQELVKKYRNKYDYIILDCPPSLGLLTINALTIADSLCVPMIADKMSMIGVDMLREFCANDMQELNPGLHIDHIFITQYLKNNLAKSVEEQMRADYGCTVTQTIIRLNTAIKEAGVELKDIVTYSPDSNGSQDYQALVKELFNV